MPRPTRASSARVPKVSLPSDAVDLVIRHVADAVFATDLENRVTFWADSAERLFGCTARDAIGRPFGELVPFEMAEAGGEAALLAAIQAGQTWRGEGSVRLPDGRLLWVESTVSPIVDGGRITGSVSVSRDKTAAHDTERALAAERRFIAAVLDSAGSLVMVTDRKGRIIRFNRACERHSGYTRPEVRGKVVWSFLVAPGERRAVRNALARVIGGAAGVVLESRWIRPDGSASNIAWTNSPLADETGLITHVISTGIDVTEERRAADALQGVESIGRALAEGDVSPAGLGAVLASLANRMGYRHLALFLHQHDGLRLAAQRGYTGAAAAFDPSIGVVGRVFRTGEAALVLDVAADPDYLAADPEVTSEIAVPLMAKGERLGVLTIEATGTVPLAASDLSLALAVADRLAGAIMLGQHQRAAADRARVFAALNDFARVANAIRDEQRLLGALLDAVGTVAPVDIIGIVFLDPPTGRYLLRAVSGIDDATIGSEIHLGEGGAGRAIATRDVVRMAALQRPDYAESILEAIGPDALSVVSVPLLSDEVALGAVTIARRLDGGRPFTDLECEAMALLGAEAALALANARLFDEVEQLAIHDSLTGLHNRRYFDATFELILARWRREAPSGGKPIAAIMFDLDHFGQFNVDYGHIAGDAVLREFAAILRGRFRANDLVARYGGEEFVVILDSSTRDGAVAAAEDVRTTLEKRRILVPGGESVQARVSAGCAAIDPDDPTLEAIIRAADVGLFMAKRAGRNQVVAV